MLPAGTVPRGEWAARGRNHVPRSMALSDRAGMELHHSVGVYGARTGIQFMQAMQRDHLSRPGWADVWYSLAIWRDGTIFEARGVEFVSSPTSLLTVCLAGNYNNELLRPAQRASLALIRTWLRDKGGGTTVGWHGARANVGCPGRNAVTWARNPPPLPSTKAPTPAPPPEEDDDLADHTAALDAIALNTKAAAEEARRGTNAQRAILADTIRRHRAEALRVPDPESDAIWATRILEGNADLAEARRRIDEDAPVAEQT